VFLKYFSDFFQANYLNIHQTDLYEIYRNGRTLAVDERSEGMFSISQGTSHGNQFSVDCIFMSRYISETA